jgi:hypothetical protein
VWYPVNAYAKRLLSAVLVISVSAILLFFVPGVDLLVYALANAGIGLAGLYIAVIQLPRTDGNKTRKASNHHELVSTVLS